MTSYTAVMANEAGHAFRAADADPAVRVVVGGGITITLSCDFRIASTDSRFSFPFSRRGIFPEGASVGYLPRLVGMSRATDWMLTGRLFGTQEALSGLDSPIPAHAADSRLIEGLADSPDAVEAVTSFLEKRAPSFPLSVPGDLPAWLPWLAPDGTP
ncbi:enoyl-CoA hydratase-related protein [Arthrobacter dokdonensis]|uniref:enoyl-CoA hydratase-related protein n=1 Tax=Arthrobacter dokdonellae TaxID=2211210 RepID=UPI001D131C7A|nr:enoyl-CoA hydratase-related protein [Arthrobacter dokdonellae]